jgi:hypothetical protein
MMRNTRAQRASELSAEIGNPDNAQRITVNLAGDVGEELHNIASRYRVSESSIVEIALRQLFRRITPAALGAFLRDHGGCLRRRRP